MTGRRLSDSSIKEFTKGAQSREPVSGLTHAFYRYPARFSPLFARAAIEAFSRPGDVVLDPFMGGATTLVEAQAAGRLAVGLDINSLSCFIANAKTTRLETADIRALKIWLTTTLRTLNLHRPASRAEEWASTGYQRNISDRSTWPIRKLIELFLDRVPVLKNQCQEVFARAVLLRTSQWALDCRSEIPSATEFRQALRRFFDEMVSSVEAFSSLTNATTTPPVILNRSVVDIDNDKSLKHIAAPTLILTSPPYPGVHVLYHRWQVLGRRETPAPYWIANSTDGHGPSYYTFGDRQQIGLDTYFRNAQSAFASLARIADVRTTFVQLIAFSEPATQLPRYLETMNAAGLTEIKIAGIGTRKDGRLWRRVPNRKWYAHNRGKTGGSQEVVLIHRVTR